MSIYTAQLSQMSLIAPNTPVLREKLGLQALSKGLIVLLCAEIVRQMSSRPWGRARQMLGGRQWIADVVAPPSVAVWRT